MQRYNETTTATTCISTNAYEKVKSLLPIDKKIAIYCRSGRRSANAAGRLADIGYKCVNLKGGIIAWKEAGKLVVTE